MVASGKMELNFHINFSLQLPRNCKEELNIVVHLCWCESHTDTGMYYDDEPENSEAVHYYFSNIV